MVTKINANSAEYVCFHEAGHAYVAQIVGARVLEMQLYQRLGRSYGRARIDRTNNQALQIALGGFAAEILLYRAGMTLKDGLPIADEKALISIAFRNASEDYSAFWRVQLQGAPPPPGLTQTEMDRIFITAANNISEQMQVSDIEPLARALLASRFLDEVAIAAPKDITPSRRLQLRLLGCWKDLKARFHGSRSKIRRQQAACGQNTN